MWGGGWILFKREAGGWSLTVKIWPRHYVGLVKLK